MKKLFLLFLITLFFTGVVLANSTTKVIKLSLNQCILQGLKKNLDLNIEILTYKESKEGVIASYGIFIPQFDLQLSSRRTKSPSSSFLEGAEITKTETDSYNLQLTQKIPTGADLSLNLQSTKTETNNRFYGFNPSYNTRLTLNFTQPLLKGFGSIVTKKEIIIATNNKKAALFGLKQKVMDIVYSIEEAYWNLVYARLNLKVKEEALKLAKDLLRKNEKQVEVGTLAPIEIMAAKAEVASRESEIIQAKAAIEQAEDNLKKLLNIVEYEKNWDYKIEPVDLPKTDVNFIIPNLNEAIEVAKNNNPLLKQQELNYKNKEINLKVAKNQMLPTLDFQASYWTTGLSGDRILYSNNDFFRGEIIGIIKGDPKDSLRDALKSIYNNWSISLNLRVPLSNNALKAQYAAAKIQYEKALLQIKNSEQGIIQEIRNAIREVESSIKMVHATRIARELAKSKLDAEIKKLSTGLSTNYQVIQYQKDYEQSKSSEVKAIIDLNIAVLKFKKAIGTLLDDYGIQFKNILENSKE